MTHFTTGKTKINHTLSTFTQACTYTHANAHTHFPKNLRNQVNFHVMHGLAK